MSRIITIVIIFAFASVSVSAQEEISFRKADSLTYALFLEGDWKKLADEGKRALETGNDFFYMRMRLGIAWYNLGNYARATTHFKKALQFNTADQLAAEYLFWSYYLSGRNLQAWAVLYRMPQEQYSRLKKESRIKSNNITAETFYSNAKVGHISADPGSYLQSASAGTQVITDRFVNNAVYLSHILGEKTSYSHAITSLVKDNILHFSDGTNQTDISQKVVQFQYYGRYNRFTPSGWIISPAFHFLTAGYPYPAFTRTGSLYTFRARSNSYAVALGITKISGYSAFTGEIIYSDLNDLKQYQGSLTGIIYPAGNRNIYLGGKISGMTGNWLTDPGIRFTGGFTAGLAVMKRVWLEFSGTSGYMRNYTENNALIVYNSIDYLTSKYTGKITIPFYKAGLTVYAGGGLSNGSGWFIPASGINTNRIDFRNYSITGGISWDF